MGAEDGGAAARVVVVFASTRRGGAAAEHEAEYLEVAAAMEVLARGQPGFVDVVSVRDPTTGRGVTVSTFTDEAAVAAWRVDVDHLVAQRRGREAFYEAYTVTVAAVTRRYSWTAP